MSSLSTGKLLPDLFQALRFLKDNECQIGQTYLTFCDWPAICCHVYNGMVLLSENVKYNVLVKIVVWNYSSIPKLSTVKLLNFGNG